MAYVRYAVEFIGAGSMKTSLAGPESLLAAGTSDLSPSVAARHACRAGMAATTAGVANGFVQGNLAILPEKLAASFHRFCQLNPKPCPIIGMSDVGDPRIPSLGIDLDIRTDVPRYRVWRDGEVVEEPTDIMAHWRDDLVAFVIGCSFSFEEALLAEDLPIRHIERNVRVPMYRTNIECSPQDRSPVRWWCRCGRSGRPMRSVRCRSPRGSLRCMARRCISAIRIRSVSAISENPIMVILAGASRRDSRVLGLRRHTAGGDRGSETIVCDHACAGIDAGDRSQKQAIGRALKGRRMLFFEALP